MLRCWLALPGPGTSHGPRGRTGAAASSAAAAEALRALAAIVCATLGDPGPDPAAAGCASLGMEPACAGAHAAAGPAVQGAGAGPGAAALASLEQLARRAADPQAAGPSPSGVGSQGEQPAAALPRCSRTGTPARLTRRGVAAAARRAAPSKPPPGFTGRFRVERGAAWRAASAARLGPLMQKALPPLCAHPSAVVRAALSRGAPRLLHCTNR